jgi:hypothetical protein
MCMYVHIRNFDVDLELRRMMPSSSATAATTTTAAAATNKKSATSKIDKSADAEVRRQAMIAAAIARERAHKDKTKTIKYVTKTTLDKQKQVHPMHNQQQHHNNNNNTANNQSMSEASRMAAAAAKQDEAALAEQLGYNPYQTAKASAGQARNATTTVQHGNITALPSSVDDQYSLSRSTPIPATTPASTISTTTTTTTTTSKASDLPIDVEEALATVLSNNNPAAVSILSKLIVNATTKGQDVHNEETAAKFRKVRLANPKIKAAVVDVSGALDLMMAVGFQLMTMEEDYNNNNINNNNSTNKGGGDDDDDDGKESCLVFPPSYDIPDWLELVLQRMGELTT